MSLEQTDVVDAIGIETLTQQVVLTIADSWDWTDEQRHLETLQKKINKYLDFIESGEVYEVYPNAKGGQLRIDVILRWNPTARAIAFLEVAQDTVAQLGIGFKYELYTAPQE